MIEPLTTERLVLRAFDESDVTAVVDLCAEPSFWWFPVRRAMTAAEAAGFLERVLEATARDDEPALHAVVERESGRLAGYTGLSVPRFLPSILPAIEVGWRLGESFRGRGYATEAARAAVAWGFSRWELDEIVSIAEPDNVASLRVMDRLGFDEGRPVTDPERQIPLRVRRLAAPGRTGA